MSEKQIPDFIQRDPDVIMQECRTFLQTALGREILPAHVEQLVLNAIVYREVLLVNRFNAGMSALLYQYATGAVLDKIAGLVAVERLPAAKAGCFVCFTLVHGHGIVTIPEGTRVASSDGQAIFETTEDLIVDFRTDAVEAYAAAQTTGQGHNGYEAGTINTILDPYPFISGVENTGPTGGGSDIETDDQLRERIRLAPSQFSSAGSRQAYLFHAKSANTLIKDVSITSPVPGTVLIVPLTDEEETSQTVIEDIYSVCSDEKVRPLTDTVIVAASVGVSYSIEVSLTLYENAQISEVQPEIESALKQYAQAKRDTLGQDIIRSHISQVCRRSSVYDVEIVQPLQNIIIDDAEFPKCESIAVSIKGFNRG